MNKVKALVVAGIILVSVLIGRSFWLSHGAFAAPAILASQASQHTGQSVTDDPNANGKWKEFKTEQFKILLPTYPKRFKISNRYNDNVTMYRSEESNGNSYMVFIATVPDSVDVSRPNTLLKNVLKGMLATIYNGKLIYAKLGSFGKCRSLDFLINTLLQVKASGHTISISGYDKGRIILAGHVFYTLTENYKSENYTENEYNRFINSLDFQGLH